jgi:S1-C subfamily serine protease
MEHMLKSIVRLHAYGKPINFLRPFIDRERESAVGTGTFVNPADIGVAVPDPDYLYILTCAHVVEKGDQITVVLPLKGSQQLPATVLSFVPKHNYDLAVVALPNPGGMHNKYMSTLPLGSSTSLVQGEKLMALGFPMGQTGLKVSDGVFAGLQHYLQHTVSISPGNSGGPLVNQAGELIGINNAGLIHVAASNIGYAVPIELYFLSARRLFNLPIGTPSPNRIIRSANFGFFLQPTTLEHLQQIATVSSENCCSTGVFIFEVVDNSPAHKAGIRAGDFLCEVQGTPVDITGDIAVEWSLQKVPIKTALERLSDPEQAYNFTIWSNTSKGCKQVTLSPSVLDANGHWYCYPPFDVVQYVDIKGFIVMPLMKNHKEYTQTITSVLKLKPKERFQPHLIITHVVPGSPADLSHTLDSGDFLTHVNGVPVSTLDELTGLLSPTHSVTLTNEMGKTTVV